MDEDSHRVTHDAISTAISLVHLVQTVIEVAITEHREPSRSLMQKYFQDLSRHIAAAEVHYESTRFDFARVMPDLADVGDFRYASYHDAAITIANIVRDLTPFDDQVSWPNACNEIRRDWPDVDFDELRSWLEKEFALVLGSVGSNEVAPISTVVRVDLQHNRVYVAGHKPDGYLVAPHLAQIVNALVEAKTEREQYVTGSEMGKLPGCRGKDISREIRERLKPKVPPLETILKSGPSGYWLNK